MGENVTLTEKKKGRPAGSKNGDTLKRKSGRIPTKVRVEKLSPEAREALTTIDDLPPDLPIPDEKLPEGAILFCYHSALFPQKSVKQVSHGIMRSYEACKQYGREMRCKMYIAKLKTWLLTTGELDPADILRKMKKRGDYAELDRDAIQAYNNIAQIQQAIGKPTNQAGGAQFVTISWATSDIPPASLPTENVKMLELTEDEDFLPEGVDA